MREILVWTWEHFFRGKSAAWVSLFTLALVVFTYLLVRVADRAEESSRAAQRAFLSFVGTSGAKILDPTAKKVVGVQMSARWENSGTTPAKDVVSLVNWQPWPYELPARFDFADLMHADRVRFVIGAKGEGTIPFNIPIDTIEQTRKGQTHMYVWGWATYHDIFPGTVTRLTEFCGEITNVTTSVVDITDSSTNIGWQVSVCKAHNCFDEECPDYKSRTSNEE
jgi:hypothetical protein